MACSLVSCSTDELSNGGSKSSSEGVQLVLSTDGFDQVSSRGFVADGIIQDVNVLEYENGTRVAGVYLDANTDRSLDFTKAIEVKGLKDLPATTMKDGVDANGNAVQVMDEDQRQNFIFVVANAGKDLTNDEQVGTFTQLKKYSVAFSGKRAGDNSSIIKVPMTGFYYGGINTSTASQMNVSLQRAVAKVNFTVDVSNFKADDGNAPSQVVINSISLCNVPTNVTLYPCQNRPTLPSGNKAGVWSGAQVAFPTSAEMQSSTTYGADDNQSTTANNFVAYIPENARGSFDDKITSNKLKIPATIGADGKSCTYINVDLNYMFTNGKEDHVTYKIYLGGNALGDMNLLRNTQYNVTTNIYGANGADTDTRITIDKDAHFDPGTVEGSQPAANCYMVNMTGTAKTLTIPIAQARKGWYWIANQTKNTTDFDAFKKALEAGNFTVEQVWTTASGTKITGKVNTTNKNYIDVTIPAGVTNGNNAVVALKSGETTYWSWHLWFTDYEPSSTGNTANNGQVHQYISVAFQPGGRYYGKYMMDRNLGATVTGVKGAISQPETTTEAVKYYGLYYQFGRKDPFVGSSDGICNTFITRYGANGTTVISSLDEENVSGAETKLADAVKEPNLFYTSDGGNWTLEKDGLWGESGVKSSFDPCPAGWRVPLGDTNGYKNIWAGFCNGNPVSTSNGEYGWGTESGFIWNVNKSGQLGTAGRLYKKGTQAWYPNSGYITYRKMEGSLMQIGTNGSYWSASPIDLIYGHLLNYSDVLVNPSNYGERAYGVSVRCVQE